MMTMTKHTEIKLREKRICWTRPDGTSAWWLNFAINVVAAQRLVSANFNTHAHDLFSLFVSDPVKTPVSGSERVPDAIEYDLV